ncbi:hypothetical protein N9C96_01455 [bacterium]|nr:hypothetical protein [bacterium]
MTLLDLIIGIAPLVLLVLLATVVVWRGMSRKPDGSHNKARGGGPRVPNSSGR